MRECGGADNGHQALIRLRADQFALVISDWNMPVLNGIERLRTIRADGALKETPFLMVTADAAHDRFCPPIEQVVVRA